MSRDCLQPVNVSEESCVDERDTYTNDSDILDIVLEAGRLVACILVCHVEGGIDVVLSED